MPAADIAILVPQLGSRSGQIVFVGWLVPLRAKVIPGERIAEIVTQGMDVHLEAELAGTLVRQHAQPGDLLTVGGILGKISPEEDAEQW